jgi:hypothetical protein
LVAGTRRARSPDASGEPQQQQHEMLKDIMSENAALKAKIAALEAENEALKPKEVVVSSSAVDGAALARPHVVCPMTFDAEWCTAACTDGGKVDIDAAGMRARITKKGKCEYLTLRSAAPLPRPDGKPIEHQPLPAYRVIIEAPGKSPGLRVGFVPSHRLCESKDSFFSAAVTPTIAQTRCIWQYAGWYIDVPGPSSRVPAAVPTPALSGWSVMLPQGMCGPDATSAYATTTKVPPMPAGSAVEFAVDYAAGTCRVAFYAPEVVAGGFVEAPHAKMELRFVKTLPQTMHVKFDRSIPTAAGSVAKLFPAVMAVGAGAVWHFADA